MKTAEYYATLKKTVEALNNLPHGARKDIAKRMNWSYQSICNTINGNQEPSQDTLLRMIDAIDSYYVNVATTKGILKELDIKLVSAISGISFLKLQNWIEGKYLTHKQYEKVLQAIQSVLSDKKKMNEAASKIGAYTTK